MVSIPNDDIEAITRDEKNVFTIRTKDGRSLQLQLSPVDMLEHMLKLEPCSSDVAESKITWEHRRQVMHDVNQITNNPVAVPLFVLPRICDCPNLQAAYMEDLRHVLRTMESDVAKEVNGRVLGNTEDMCEQYEQTLIDIYNRSQKSSGESGEEEEKEADALKAISFGILSEAENENVRALAKEKAARLRDIWRRTAREQLQKELSKPSATGESDCLKGGEYCTVERLKDMMWRTWHCLRRLLLAVSVVYLLGMLLTMVAPGLQTAAGIDVLRTALTGMMPAPIVEYVCGARMVALIQQYATAPAGIYTLLLGSFTIATQGGLYTVVTDAVRDMTTSTATDTLNRMYETCYGWVTGAAEKTGLTAFARAYHDRWWFRLVKGILITVPLVVIRAYLWSTATTLFFCVALPFFVGVAFYYAPKLLAVDPTDILTDIVSSDPSQYVRTPLGIGESILSRMVVPIIRGLPKIVLRLLNFPTSVLGMFSTSGALVHEYVIYDRLHLNSVGGIEADMTITGDGIPVGTTVVDVHEDSIRVSSSCQIVFGKPYQIGDKTYLVDEKKHRSMIREELQAMLDDIHDNMHDLAGKKRPPMLVKRKKDREKIMDFYNKQSAEQKETKDPFQTYRDLEKKRKEKLAERDKFKNATDSNIILSGDIPVGIDLKDKLISGRGIPENTRIRAATSDTLLLTKKLTSETTGMLRIRMFERRAMYVSPNQLQVASRDYISNGMVVTGDHVPKNTTVVNVENNTIITLSKNMRRDDTQDEGTYGFHLQIASTYHTRDMEVLELHQQRLQLEKKYHGLEEWMRGSWWESMFATQIPEPVRMGAPVAASMLSAQSDGGDLYSVGARLVSNIASPTANLRSLVQLFLTKYMAPLYKRPLPLTDDDDVMQMTVSDFLDRLLVRRTGADVQRYALDGLNRARDKQGQDHVTSITTKNLNEWARAKESEMGTWMRTADAGLLAIPGRTLAPPYSDDEKKPRVTIYDANWEKIAVADIDKDNGTDKVPRYVLKNLSNELPLGQKVYVKFHYTSYVELMSNSEVNYPWLQDAHRVSQVTIDPSKVDSVLEWGGWLLTAPAQLAVTAQLDIMAGVQGFADALLQAVSTDEEEEEQAASN